ncbi:hypothetical protein T492DRAFT_845004 [Pavlovales sp. CCMP2436]|nr:hypothetical protein T492DRAFT_845004 [Pavlovales sp. CCMP2436]
MYSALRLQPQVRKFASPFFPSVVAVVEPEPEPLNTLASVSNGVFTFTNSMASADYVVSLTNAANSANANRTPYNYSITGFATIVCTEGSGPANMSSTAKFSFFILIVSGGGVLLAQNVTFSEDLLIR